MKITIFAVGKIKEKYLTEGIREYIKRLSRYAEVNIIEVKDEPAPERLSSADEIRIKDIEGQRILQKVSSDSFLVALDLQGKMMDSVQLAAKIMDIQIYHSSHIVWIIGGSLGLSEQVLAQANERLSFGPMTYPHQLMRLILLEQIYRSFRINNNEPYHK